MTSLKKFVRTKSWKRRRRRKKKRSFSVCQHSQMVEAFTSNQRRFVSRFSSRSSSTFHFERSLDRFIDQNRSKTHTSNFFCIFFNEIFRFSSGFRIIDRRRFVRSEIISKLLRKENQKQNVFLVKMFLFRLLVNGR